MDEKDVAAVQDIVNLTELLDKEEQFIDFYLQEVSVSQFKHNIAATSGLTNKKIAVELLRKSARMLIQAAQYLDNIGDDNAKKTGKEIPTPENKPT